MHAGGEPSATSEIGSSSPVHCVQALPPSRTSSRRAV